MPSELGQPRQYILTKKILSHRIYIAGRPTISCFIADLAVQITRHY